MAAAPGGGSSGSGGVDGSYRWQDTCLAQAGGGSGAAQIAPAAENNKAPILAVLRRHLPPGTRAVLEVASGTGQHVAHFAAALDGIQWQPSDLTDELFPSIAAHAAGLDNVRQPAVLDASWPPERWAAALAGGGSSGGGGQAGGGGVDAVIVANMTHISPWPATLGLLAAAGSLLPPGGVLSIYGPFMLAGQFTTDSNRAFHERLVVSNPEWGYRDTDAIAAAAAPHGLVLAALEEMPANNFTLVFKKQGSAAA